MSLLTIPEFLAQPVPADLWLVDTIVPSSGWTLVLGPPKTGKSIWSLQCTLALAAGTPFLGFGCPMGARRVAYLQCDAPLGEWSAEVKRFAPPAGPAGYFTGIYPRGFLTAPEFIRARLTCKGELADFGVDVLVIDALESATAGTGTNEKKEADRVIHAMDDLAQGRPYLVVHHPRKSDPRAEEPESAQNAAAGHHSFSSACAAIVALTETTMSVITRHTRRRTVRLTRQGPDGHPQAGGWLPQPAPPAPGRPPGGQGSPFAVRL